MLARGAALMHSAREPRGIMSLEEFRDIIYTVP